MIETGNTLKSTREAMGLSLEEVFKDLDIPVIQLEQIEAGAVGAFDDIYELKRMMLEYAKYLGINTEDVEKKFNEYIFDYTSKIPMNEIQKAINAKEKEDDEEDRIASPYTQIQTKEKVLPYIIIGIIIVVLIILAVIWSINQIAINNGASDSIGLIR